MLDAKAHWENVYNTKAATQVSWYQPHPVLSLELIRATGVTFDEPIMDVVGGASTLVDDLLDAGYENITVLDISANALEVARARLGERAPRVNWLEADVTHAQLPREHFAVWHDRAVFHFLTDALARKKYVDTVRDAVKIGGHVIVASFALDGPEMCSGLQVQRYDAESMHATFGDAFRLISSQRENHQTPWGSEQKFIYCYCRREKTRA